MEANLEIWVHITSGKEEVESAKILKHGVPKGILIIDCE
jgi:hypothetical protein